MRADFTQAYMNRGDILMKLNRSVRCLVNNYSINTHLYPTTADMNDWMKASRLRLNPSKTEVMWLGTSQQLDKILVRNLPLLSTVIAVVDSVSVI